MATNPARSGSERPLPEEAAVRSVVEGAASAPAVTANTSPAAATAPSSGDGGASPAPNDSDPPLSLGGADRDDSGDSTAASGPELEGWPEDMASSSTVMGTTLGSASSHVTKEPLLMLPGCTTTYFLSGHSVTCSRRTPHVIQWGRRPQTTPRRPHTHLNIGVKQHLVKLDLQRFGLCIAKHRVGVAEMEGEAAVLDVQHRTRRSLDEISQHEVDLHKEKAGTDNRLDKCEPWVCRCAASHLLMPPQVHVLGKRPPHLVRRVVAAAAPFHVFRVLR